MQQLVAQFNADEGLWLTLESKHGRRMGILLRYRDKELVGVTALRL